ncbi:MAG: single-stranded-DNA-specific exonuclease RecJ [Coxiella sp. (in: Bacteria)]|nr:MAG: single-stranded-DNA-specific exonuclease RecJ [Coxiella sp. (in: g-proteobacteria)]
MQKKIVQREVLQGVGELANFHPLLQRIYATREISSADDVSRKLSDLLPYAGLKGIQAASERLAIAVEDRQRILIVGDFDADGATSTTLAVQSLRAMGAASVDYIVPNRFEYGYGLTPEIVEVAKIKAPDLIVTVDNGISSLEGVARANELGIDVVVTDHHLAGAELPAACAIVNPNQPGDTFPSKCMAGVGVIFYVMLALRSYLHEINWFLDQKIKSPNMADFLDLVALGTVADVVPLDKNNRIMVHQGMRRIRAGHCRQGILALLDIARRNRNCLVASDLGYVIGPRLNAAGRLDDMSRGIECMLSDDYQRAFQIAQQLDQLNHERRALEMQMRDEAFNHVDKLEFDNNLPMGLCLYDEHWHQGIVGLVASRVKEKMHLPTIAFAKASDDMIKGSARSIKGLHIRDTLDAIAKRCPELITKFGGHAMAAGLSIKLSDFDAFKLEFAKQVALALGTEALERVVESDGQLEIENFTLEIAELLRESGPWGQGFPEPTFDGHFKITDQRLVGEKHLKLTLQVPGGQYFLDAIAFNVDLKLWPNTRCYNVYLAYRLDVNEYRGRRKLQLIVEHLEAEPVKTKEAEHA